MAVTSRYCKAYPLGRLRAYAAWTESDASRALSDDAIVYLHDSYTVTDGIFLDDHVLFAQLTPDWKTFCATALEFEIPADIASDLDRPART
jgi:hypothetical protein